MQVAVYGGSFNPPHVGHAMVASWLLWTAQVDQVWLMPTLDHPFAKSLAPFPLRLRMCQALADAIGEGVQVCDVERSLPRPSYTIRTLRHLARTHPDLRFRLVMGADNLPDLPKWREADRLREEFPLLVVGRSGWPTPEGSIAFPDVSSTEVRRRLQAGQPVDHLVPAAVLAVLGEAYARGSQGQVGQGGSRED